MEKSQNKQSNDKKSNDKKADAFKMIGNWSEQSKELKNKFSQLTDDDLKVESGKENDMIKRMETRLNKNRDEVVNIIKKGQPKSV